MIKRLGNNPIKALTLLLLSGSLFTTGCGKSQDPAEKTETSSNESVEPGTRVTISPPPRPADGSFHHPGLLSAQADLDRMAAKVAAAEQPWKGSWVRLVRNTDGFLNNWIRANDKVLVDSQHGNNFILLARETAKAYQCALRYHGSGDKRFADQAIAFLNTWAAKHKEWEGNSNVSLRKGIYGYQFACAAELMRNYEGWKPEDFKAFQQYMLDQFYGGNAYFLETKHGTVPMHYWSNWTLANVASMMAIGVLCDRQDIFDDAVNYYKGIKKPKLSSGSESIENSVVFRHPNGLGQWQESGRDQAHTLMGPALASIICEIAWNQGIDLYGYKDNLFLSSVEYISKYNVGMEVPFVTYVYVHKHPGKELFWVHKDVHSGGRGNHRPGWDMIYHHYVNRLGMAAPWTNEYAKKIRPEGGGHNYGGNSGGFDGLGFTTLTHSLDPIDRGNVPDHLRPYVEGRQITLSWSGSAYAESYNVKRSTKSGGPYTNIAMVGSHNLYYVDPGLTAGKMYYYVVSANTPHGETANSDELAVTADKQLHGKIIGTDGSYQNSGATKEVVFDGSMDNYFDPPSDGSWAGLDLGNGVSAVLKGVRYAPRPGFGFTSRMVGGKFQGSNDPTFSNGVVDLFTIENEPQDGVLTNQQIKSSDAFRCFRYIVPAGMNGWTNVAEVQFLGDVQGLTPPSTPSAPSIRSGTDAVDLSWNAAPGADSYNVKRSTNNGESFVIIENTPATRLRDIQLGDETCHYVVSAVNSTGESANSVVSVGQVLKDLGQTAVAYSANAFNSYWGPDTEAPAKCFDGNRETQWYTGDKHDTGWLQVDLGTGKASTVVSYSITTSKDEPNRDPKDWQLLGSNDANSWETLDTRKGEAFKGRGETRTFPVVQVGAYRFYRLNVQSNLAGNSNGIQFAEFKLMGYGGKLQEIAINPVPQNPNTKREITRKSLENKIRGYWLGQLIGNYFGFPFELLYIEEPVPVEVNKFFTQRNRGNIRINTDWRGNMDHQVRDHHGAPSDDDHDLEFLILHAVEKYGLDITYEEIAPMLDRHVKKMVWVSTEHAIKEIRKGALPPSTGTRANNPWWHDLMASISTEIWGSFYPGMTQSAANGGEWFGRITNDDYAIYLAKFYTAMYAAAFFESDHKELIRIGLKQVPKDNVLYQGIEDVHKWVAANPNWRDTRKLIYDKYYRQDKPKDLSSIVDALPNGLMGIMAWLYAEGDFKQTLSISTAAGLDSDNQPATLGGLIGVIEGADSLPQDYKFIFTENAKSPFYGTYVNHTREGLPDKTSMNDIIKRIADVAEKAILANGGEKKVNPDGKVTYIIPTDF